MDGIEKARVALNQPAPALYADEKASASAAICLWFKEGARPSQALIEGIAVFATRAVPSLSITNVSIVDSAGRMLFERGKAVPEGLRVAGASVTAGQQPPKADGQPWSGRPVVAALLLCLVAFGTALTAIVLRRSRRPQAAVPGRPAERADGPMVQGPPLSGIGVDAMVSTLARERPQVVAFALSRMGADEAREVLARMPDDLRQDAHQRLSRMRGVAPAIAAAAESFVENVERSLENALGADNVEIEVSWVDELRSAAGVVDLPPVIRRLAQGDSPLTRRPKVLVFGVSYGAFRLTWDEPTQSVLVQAAGRF